MKKLLLLSGICFLVLLGSGCSKTKNENSIKETEVKISSEVKEEIPLKTPILKSLSREKDKEFKFNFNTFVFPASSFADYPNNIGPILLNGSKELQFEPNVYTEVLTITEINEFIYWFNFQSLGEESFYILNLQDYSITKPFFDMEKKVSIQCVDYDNKILFGSNWNSDKGLDNNFSLELILFSSAKNEHFVIDSKKGDFYRIKLLDNNILEYNNEADELVTFDYSDWI